MAQVKHGDVVRVHYTGKLVSGDQFDSSVGREPLEFTVGAGMMIKGFDDAMPGMAVGEKKTVNILFMQTFKYIEWLISININILKNDFVA